MLELFPDTARVEDGELVVGGLQASSLADEFGTPVVVYCEETVIGSARAYRRAAPDAFLAYGVKAFPNVEILRLLAEEGFGADVSTLGELTFALRAGLSGDRLVVHGNNKSDEELRAAADAGARFVVLDALDEIERASRAGVTRVLVRVTPGIEADTHESIRTAHHGSKFGLAPDEALDAISQGQAAGLHVAGLHCHIGSQLMDTQAAEATVDWLAGFAARAHDALDWTPRTINLGGGLGAQYTPDAVPPTIEEFVSVLMARVEEQWKGYGLATPDVVLEPGRSLVARAGLTLYRIGVVKKASDAVTYVAIDGGMSDNPRPQLYGARYSALVANRADERPSGDFAVCGKHCESGDVLIQNVPLAEPRRDDLLAVPVTGAYTLGMASTYNAVPRPAAILVRDGEVRTIRRRETIDDLIGLDAT